MTDVRLKQDFNIFEPTMDFFLRDNGLLDEREELATSVRVALGTDALAAPHEILPDPDSSNRKGWWGNLDAETIWDGWPIGTKNWLLTRSKIVDVTSAEGSTLERARQYTLDALQPFIDRRVATYVEVSAVRTELNRIEVYATIYRGPLPEIELRYQLLWQEKDDIFVPINPIALTVPDAILRVNSSLSLNLFHKANIRQTLPIRSSLFATGNIKPAARATLRPASGLTVNTLLHGRQTGSALLTGAFGLKTSPGVLRNISARVAANSALAANLSLPPSMIESLQALGLTTGLKLCLDAGDANSYNPAIQTSKWLDTSGNGYDFWRANNPVFNGTAGRRSGNNYWDITDDFFSYDSSNEAWMNRLHMTGARFSWCMWVRPSGGNTNDGLWGTNGNGLGTGMSFSHDTDNIRFQLQNFWDDTEICTYYYGDNDDANMWSFYAGSVNDSGRVNFIQFNTNVNHQDQNYGDPSPDPAYSPLQICACGNGERTMTGRIAMFAMWEGAALTQAQLTAIRTATNRFGV